MTASLPATLPPGMTTGRASDLATRSRLLQSIDALDAHSCLGLLAHCASLSVNAVQVTWDRRPHSLRHAGQLSNGADLDITRYWTVTVESYLGRVFKLRILEAVQEAVSP